MLNTDLEFRLLYRLLSSNFERSLSEKKYTSLLFLSKLVYLSDDDIYRTLESLGAVKVKLAAKDSAEAIYIEFPDTDVLVFRGTEPSKAEDWRTILSFVSHPFVTGVSAHKGFVSSARALYQQLEMVLHIRDPSRPLIYSGHSMGGAIALLFALFAEPTYIVTYGQPRVFHKSSVLPEVYSRVEITRLKTTYDFVPSLPMQWQGYYHIGKEILLPFKFSALRPIYQHSLSAYLSCLLDQNIDVW